MEASECKSCGEIFPAVYKLRVHMISLSLGKRFVKQIGLMIKAYQPVAVGQVNSSTEWMGRVYQSCH